MMRILITGASGFIGSELLRQSLYDSKITKIYACFRPLPQLTPEQRLRQLCGYWQKFFSIPAHLYKKVHPIALDLTKTMPFEDAWDVDYIFHTAASTDLAASLTYSRVVNLYGTQRVVQWALQCPHLKRLVHFSTAYVLSSAYGEVFEDQFPKKFRNAYEQSKWEAECVLHATENLPYTILRPSLVVGRSDNGYVRGIKIIYAVLRMWLTGQITRIPINPKGRVDLVPVDYVTRAAIELAQSPVTVGETYHLTAGPCAALQGVLLDAIRRHYPKPEIKLAPQWVGAFLVSPFMAPFLNHSLREILQRAAAQLMYFGRENFVFNNEKAQGILEPLGVLCPSIEEYVDQLFYFCKKTDFGKKGWVCLRST